MSQHVYVFTHVVASACKLSHTRLDELELVPLAARKRLQMQWKCAKTDTFLVQATPENQCTVQGGIMATSHSGFEDHAATPRRALMRDDATEVFSNQAAQLGRSLNDIPLPIFPYMEDSPFAGKMELFKFPVRVGDAGRRGRGLFATEDIAKDQVVTLYPCHVLEDQAKQPPFRMLDQADGDAVLADTRGTYGMALRGTRTVYIHGNPAKTTFNWACGHMANDPYPDIDSLETAPRTPRSAGRAFMKYLLHVDRTSNSVLETLAPDYVGGIVAVKDIAVGEEILAPYGYDYWCSDRPGVCALLNRFRHAATAQEWMMCESLLNRPVGSDICRLLM